MSKIKLAILYGGKSSEHEVSLISAESVISAVNKEKYEITKVFIAKNGDWLFNKEKQEPGDILKKVDCVFPVLHGSYGEDGTVQGLLELANVPYVGAGVLASALGMDKALQKKVYQEARLPVVPYLVFLRKGWVEGREIVIKKIEKEFKYPMFIKPANLGSSVGISKAHDRNELVRGIDSACKYDRKFLVEAGINCREIEVAVLGNDDPKASIPGEIVPSREFYSYEAKYLDNASKIIIPTGLAKEQVRKIQEFAIGAFEAIDCAGMARVDFFLEKETKKIYIDEINTIPGFTKISMYPKLWEASGIPYADLIDKLVELAFERFKDKLKNKTDYASN